jgi:formylglycine-generating enzyme
MNKSMKMVLASVLLIGSGCHRQTAPVTVNAVAGTATTTRKPEPATNNSNASSEMKMADALEHSAMHDDMVFIAGGTFLMGTGDGLAVERPVHQVSLKSFWIDKYAVTVAQFARFVEATGYKTESEKLGWSGVFDRRAGQWLSVAGADWRHPDGPESSAALNEPVTHVSWNDAMAYAVWAKKRLPTEAEFEYAARGGLAGNLYSWGNVWRPNGKYMANCWQGNFPVNNTGEDGFTGRAPVGSFPANGYGLYDMTGNVWEWCADWFDENYYQASPRANPQGPAIGQDRVIRGGSWLCSDSYCAGFRVAARNHAAPDSGLNNLGFRCAGDN